MRRDDWLEDLDDPDSDVDELVAQITVDAYGDEGYWSFRQAFEVFYVVAYNGRDPITGRERRRWHRAGSDHNDAQALQQRLDRQRPTVSCDRTLGGFMTTTWLSTKPSLTHATANRYRWMIDHNIGPRVGTIRDMTGPYRRHHRRVAPIASA